MVDFLKLPHELRCNALVGTFMQSWANMEAHMNRAIIAALELDQLQGTIVVRNVQLRSKVHILKTAIYHALPEGEHEQYINLLNKIISMSETDRNVAAHDMFGPDNEGDGIEFLVTKAKGQLKFPEVRWSVAECQQKFADLMHYSKQLQALTQHLKNRSLLRHMRKNPLAALGSFEASPLGLLSHPPQESQSSDTDPSIAEKDE